MEGILQIIFEVQNKINNNPVTTVIILPNILVCPFRCGKKWARFNLDIAGLWCFLQETVKQAFHGLTHVSLTCFTT